ncbi:MAG: hypothetical protein ABMA25_09495 [Ilumatobacteraceae bacterium]
MNLSLTLIPIVHLVATACMAGLIWFVQVVHYPLFAAVGADGFATYERAHQRLTSFVVGPFMAVEGVTVLWLFVAPPAGLSRVLPLVGGLVLAVVHASTVLLQVPQHGALSAGYDPARVARLIRTNWVRTIGWSVRAVIAAVIVGTVAA